MTTTIASHNPGRFGTIHPGEKIAEPGPFPISEKPTVVAVHASGRLGFASFQNDWHRVAYEMRIPLIHSEGLHWEQHLSMGLEKALASSAEYILTLDWDSAFCPDDIKALIDFMQKNPDVAAVWPQQMTRHAAHMDTILCNDPSADYTQDFTQTTFGHFGCTVFRRQVFERVPQPWLHAFAGNGGWNDPSSVHADIFLWRKLADRGYKVGQLNTVQIGHLEMMVIWPDGDMRQVQLPGEYRAYGKPTNSRWYGKDAKVRQGVTRLNLGSGRKPKEGFVSVDGLFDQDIYPLPHADNSVDEIYASHCLEHFSHRDTEKVLREWVRVLKPGGRLRLAVPDFRAICSEYLRGEKQFDLNGFVMGGHQRHDDIHGALFDRVSLVMLLQRLGVENVSAFESKDNDCSSLWFSLNVQGTKSPAAAPVVDLRQDGDTSPVEKPELVGV